MSSHHQPTTDFSIEKLLCDDSNSKLFKQKQRRRSSFTAIQVHWLEAEFRCHRYVSPERRAGLAALLGLTQQQIKIWFQNRRYKTKFRQGNIPPHLPNCSHFSQRSNGNTFYSGQSTTTQEIFKILHRPNLWNSYSQATTKLLENKIPKIDYSTQSQNNTQ